MVMGLERSETILLPSRLLAPWVKPPDFPLTFESMLLELERCELLEATPLDDFAGLGSERYCSETFEPPQLIKMASSWGCDPSKLVFRTPTIAVPLPRVVCDLGAFPNVADPLAKVAPLEVMRAPEGPGSFLYPNELAAGGRAMPDGGFLPSSPLLFPASDGERWIPDGDLDDALPFSEALVSSVLPGVLRAADGVLVLGGVIPT